MSEPKKRASRVEIVTPGVFHWTVKDDRIGSRGDAYAVSAPGGRVLIDPHPLTEKGLGTLDHVVAICLTIQSHQRSAWRYRRRFAVPVYAPRFAEGLEEEPDLWFDDGYALPGGIVAKHTPGPCDASFTFLREGDDGKREAFTGDLLIHARGGDRLDFVPDEYQDAPAQTRASVRSLLSLRVDSIFPGHGTPLLMHASEAIRHALERDAGGALLSFE